MQQPFVRAIDRRSAGRRSLRFEDQGAEALKVSVEGGQGQLPGLGQAQKVGVCGLAMAQESPRGHRFCDRRQFAQISVPLALR